MENEKVIGRQDVDYIELLYENENISIYQLDAVHLGLNRSNMSIDEDCIRVSLPSFADAPLYCVIDNQYNQLDSKRNDFLEHFREEYPDKISRDRVLPFGTVPESAISKAKLVQRDDKTYLRIQVIVWKRLLPHVSDILQRRDGSVKVSVEFVIDDASVEEDTGTVNIHKFTITAITALGDKFTEVMEGSMLKSVKFSFGDYLKNCKENYCVFAQQEEIEIPKEVLNALRDGISVRDRYGRGGTPADYRNVCSAISNKTMPKSQAIDMYSYFSSIDGGIPAETRTKTNKYIMYELFGGEVGKEWVTKMAKPSIKIVNTKEDAVHSSSWSNPGSKLYEPMLEASNTVALVKEGYLVVEDGYEDAPSEKLKYPHHLVRSGELNVDIAGVEAALKRAVQQGIFRGEVYDHLKKHYTELGLDMGAFKKDEKNAVDEKEEPDVKNAEADVDNPDKKEIDKKDIKNAEAVEEDDKETDKEIDDEDDEKEDEEEKEKKEEQEVMNSEEDVTEKCARMEKENSELCAKLAEYTRREDKVAAKASIEKFGHCFDNSARCALEAKIDCADFSKDVFDSELCAKVMEFAVGLKDVMNAEKADETDLPEVHKNAFFNFQKEVKRNDMPSEIDGVIKRQKTRVK